MTVNQTRSVAWAVAAALAFWATASLAADPFSRDTEPRSGGCPGERVAAGDPLSPALPPGGGGNKDAAVDPAEPVAPAPAEKAAAKPATQGDDPREIHVAVFDFDVLKGVDMEPAALTDHVNTLFATMDGVTIVNRDQIHRVADEHKMVLAGLIDAGSAAQLGKFLSADYVVTGRASKIGQTNYLVLKLIDVNTTVQTTVAAKAAVTDGLDALLDRLKTALEPKVAELQKPLAVAPDVELAKVRQAGHDLAGKVVLVDVSEQHINRPLIDPAAQLAIVRRLKAVGVEAFIAKDPPDGWKKSLLETGKYGEKKVDFLLEGEGTSAFAATMEGLISCRARVELRLIPTPGREVAVNDRGVGAKVDLVEALAAKGALEDAGVNAVDAVLIQRARTAVQPGKEEKK